MRANQESSENHQAEGAFWFRVQIGSSLRIKHFGSAVSHGTRGFSRSIYAMAQLRWRSSNVREFPMNLVGWPKSANVSLAWKFGKLSYEPDYPLGSDKRRVCCQVV